MRPSGRRALPWFLALSLALALALWGHLARGPRPPAQPARKLPAAPAALKPPGLEFEKTRLKVHDPRTGRVVWELTLEKAESSAASGEAWLSGVAAVYHNLDGTESRLSAGRGRLEAGGKALVFDGEVVLSATNGGRLKAGLLRWEAGREEFRASGAPGGAVSFTRGPTVLTAPEIVGDMALKKVRATGGVRLSGGQGR